MKAWFVHPVGDNRGYVLHGMVSGQAKHIALNNFVFDGEDWLSLAVVRYPALDDKPITLQSLIDTGLDMTFDGEPITEIDLECQCPICKEATP
jgi:hypothetical protein